MEFFKTPVSVCEYNRQLKTKTKLEADVIVPDTRPDIARILNVKAVADVGECCMRKDKVIFSGRTKFTVLYVGEDDLSRIYSIEYSLPFNHQTDMPGVNEETPVRSRCSVSATGFDVKNSRKLSVVATLNLSVAAHRQADVEAIIGTEDAMALPAKTKECNFDSVIASENFDIELADTINLSISDENCEIYTLDIRPDIIDIKTVNNKAIIKGNAAISVLYLADGEISTHETETSFTEIVDVNAMQAEQTVISSFEVAEMSYAILPSEVGTRLDVDCRIKGNLSAYENKTCALITDIYSPDYNYALTTKKANLLHVEKCSSYEETIKDIISFSDSDASVSKVHYMDVSVSDYSASQENGSFCIKGNVETVIIYSDEEDSLNRSKHITPFEMQVPCRANGTNSIADASVWCVNHSFSLASSREIQIRCVLKADADLTFLEEAELITDFNVDVSNPIQKNSQAGIVIVYPTRDIDIWSLAKKYNTTSEEIIKINSLDATTQTLGNKPVLIPKRPSV